MIINEQFIIDVSLKHINHSFQSVIGYDETRKNVVMIFRRIFHDLNRSSRRRLCMQILQRQTSFLLKNCKNSIQTTYCQSSVVCVMCSRLVSIFGLFPVLVSCHYELSMFQLCFVIVVNYPVYLVPVF